MKCPICGSGIRGNFCPKCGLDYDTLARAGVVSDFLYNRGLVAARHDCMTDAITYLTKSIEFDKMNKHALNLLGLCYYNTGKINEALKAWVLSFHYYGTNTDAARYLKAVEMDSAKLDDMRNAASLYNKALSYAKQNNDDLAIARLKTAVEDSPNFIDALNLTALCYMRLKNKKAALECVERVLDIDTGNVVALAYYKELAKAGGRQAVTRDVYFTPRGYAPSTKLRRDDVHKRTLPEKFKFLELVFFLIGIAMTAVFMLFVVFPGINESQNDELLTERNTLADQVRNFEAERNELMLQISDLETELAGIDAEREQEMQELKAEIANLEERILQLNMQLYENEEE